MIDNKVMLVVGLNENPSCRHTYYISWVRVDIIFVPESQNPYPYPYFSFGFGSENEPGSDFAKSSLTS